MLAFEISYTHMHTHTHTNTHTLNFVVVGDACVYKCDKQGYVNMPVGKVGHVTVP